MPTHHHAERSRTDYRGRHRGSQQGARLSHRIGLGLLIPSAAVAAVVLSATAAAGAQPSQVSLDLSGTTAAIAMAQTEDEASVGNELAQVQNTVAESNAAALGQEEAKAKIEKAKADSQAWVRPLKPWNFTSPYGYRWGRLHAGDDFGAATGTPLYSMSKGVVTYAGWMDGYGNKVEIKYWDGTVSYYGHMSRVDVRVGQPVQAGQTVGAVGNTGHSFGSHLHLEIHPGGGAAIDPKPWLEAKGLW